MSTEERREVKKKLRREVLARRAALTEPERERGNLLITERILGHQWYYLSDTILGFVSYGSEICTTEILENALQDGKRVYVPKEYVDSIKRNMKAQLDSIETVSYTHLTLPTICSV